ncbi:hypothetical protein [Gryllotalpicola protaetiae]|uniref:Pilus assembly protein PilO n=1 Tax=Gryllotalpicola protaetiae TaxID=2419771 RepID=A0A387BKZ7_9MICO|nr:hypothetical protein [Gryllotalpicola protaetiae]AYG03002.1 hypothetical protein D7I44_05315 [Gryllotalpicola protaetiae]
MNANRLWLIGGVVVAALVAVLAWVVGIHPQLQQASAADEQKISAQSQLQQTELQLGQLKKDYASIDALKAQLATLQQSVPGTQKVTDFFRQVAQQSGAANVSVTSITVGEPTAYAPTAAGGSAPASTPAPTASASAPASGGTATPAPSATPTPNATSVAVAPPVSTDPLINNANFVMLPVSLSATGDTAAVSAFTSAVQNQGPRLFLVNKITLAQNASAPDTGTKSSTPTAASPAETATLSGFIYVLVGNS